MTLAGGSYAFLLLEMDRAMREQGRLDPETLIQIGEEAEENSEVSLQEARILHREIESRLRGILGGFSR